VPPGTCWHEELGMGVGACAVAASPPSPQPVQYTVLARPIQQPQPLSCDAAASPFSSLTLCLGDMCWQVFSGWQGQGLVSGHGGGQHTDTAGGPHGAAAGG